MATLLSNRDRDALDLDEMVVETKDDFRVNGAVYTDPRIFDLEMDRIFGRTWVYVAHESEIPNPGDFKTTTIGLRPVLVTRDVDGGIHVLLNRCRHRANVVCRQLSGNAPFHSCRYHGWTYGADGALVSIPQAKGAYPDDMDRSKLGLMPVARVTNYGGLIFANMSATGPDFETFLGPCKRFLDYQLDHAPNRKFKMNRGIHRTEYRGNWKFQVENSTDGYHGNTVHETFWKVMHQFGNRGGQHGNYAATDIKKILKRREEGATYGFENGHGILEYPLPETGLDTTKPGPEGEYLRTLEAKHGRAGLEAIMPQYNVMLFPSVGILLDQIRLVRPIAPDRTEVTIQLYDLEDVPDEVNRKRFDGYERFFGPSAFGSPDDVEMFAMNQTGLAAKEVEWLILSRGMIRERTDDEGIRISHPTDETPQRAFHRAWKRMMAAA